MDTQRLEQLGLEVRQGASGAQVLLDLGDAILRNPLTHQQVTQVTFEVAEDRLVPCAPPAVVGLMPIAVNVVQDAKDVASLLTQSFLDHISHVERRSAELQVLGLSPNVDPETLELSAELEEGPFTFRLAADRQGQFRVASARRGGEALSVGHPFELSEFRERAALTGYLTALFGETPARPQAVSQGAGTVRFSELVEAFGPVALVPPRSTLELLVQLTVDGAPYRFAAARVAGRTFRGLLAGAKGKVWAGRFELDDFPGIVRLVAELLKVSPEAVKLVGPDATQE